MIAKSHRWQKVALLAASSLGLWGSSAMALSLGRVAVQSALGEPLRAEVEVLNINAEEAASLKVAAALPESFRAAGLEYNQALSTLQASLQRLSDGRAYIRLSSDRVINEPFVDLILETTWASGRIVRDYTLLFDPPGLRTAVPSAPTPAQVTAQPPSSQTRVTPTGAVAPLAPAMPKASRTAEPYRVAAKAAPGTGAQVTVKPGDTASRIASATRPDNVSLDQMLVALLRTNPVAFLGDNVNRIRAGAIINIPTPEQAAATPVPEATQIIVAQSRDFNDFRRKLALGAPDTTLAPADRQASGTVQARVDDKKPAASAPDKLTLSKGAVQQMTAEDQLAKERSAKEVASRAAEIAKNISDLDRLGAASAPAKAGAATIAASAPAIKPPLAAASASGPVASMAVKTPIPAPTAAPQAGPMDGLMDNPLAPAGAAGLVALLALLGIYRRRQHKSAPQADSVGPENRMRPDTFFAVSGGQSVDTRSGAMAGSSVIYAPSQPTGGVEEADPVAEAEVYLAYGRDMQAEEILKDALRANPDRIAIHQKLLDLFAKRRDTKSFERIARKLFRLTKGEGDDWQRIRELGLGIDPENPRYQPGWQPPESDAAASMPAPLESAAPPADSRDGATSPGPAPQISNLVDLDLDLDFSLDEEPAEAAGETSSSVAPTAPGKLGAAAAEPDPEAPAAPDHGMLEFDLGSLSLDLDDSTEPQPDDAAGAPEDPLTTKLELAEEFSAIGDAEGARTLIEEVIAEASGEMKLKAQRALSGLQSA
ncbi:MAG: FimV/HubP family polar landmark protein [Rhodoferax sp.]